MGYNLTIGKKIENPNLNDILEDMIDDEYSREEALFSLESIKYIAKDNDSKNAPAFGEPTDYTNQRWPSYTSWYVFCKSVDIYNIFYTESGHLKGDHPGYFEITKEISDELESKYKRFQMQYKKAKSTFDKSHPNHDKLIYISGERNQMDQNGALARFEWLMYWVRDGVSKFPNELIISNT